MFFGGPNRLSVSEVALVSIRKMDQLLEGRLIIPKKNRFSRVKKSPRIVMIKSPLVLVKLLPLVVVRSCPWYFWAVPNKKLPTSLPWSTSKPTTTGTPTVKAPPQPKRKRTSGAPSPWKERSIQTSWDLKSEGFATCYSCSIGCWGDYKHRYSICNC